MVWYFISLTTDFKIREDNQGLHFMDNEASTAFKIAMTTVEIKYWLVPQVITGQIMQREPSIRSKHASYKHYAA